MGKSKSIGVTTNDSIYHRPRSTPDLVSVYIDDIILLFSHTLKDHLEDLEKVLSHLAKAGFKLKPSKCQFIRQEVDFLVHVITPQGLKIN